MTHPCRECGRPDNWTRVVARIQIEIDTAREAAEERVGTDTELYSRGYLAGMMVIAERHLSLPRDAVT